MTAGARHPLSRFFQCIVAWRRYVIASYALLLVPSVYFAIQVHQDNSIDRLIVETIPITSPLATSNAFSGPVSLPSCSPRPTIR